MQPVHLRARRSSDTEIMAMEAEPLGNEAAETEEIPLPIGYERGVDVSPSQHEKKHLRLEEQNLFKRIENMIVEAEETNLMRSVDRQIVKAEEVDLLEKVNLRIQEALRRADQVGEKVIAVVDLTKESGEKMTEQIQDWHLHLAKEEVERVAVREHEKRSRKRARQGGAGHSVVYQVEELGDVETVSRKLLPKYRGNSRELLFTQNSLNEHVVKPIIEATGKTRISVEVEDDTCDPFSVLMTVSGLKALVEDSQRRVEGLLVAAQMKSAGSQAMALVPIKASSRVHRGHREATAKQSAYLHFAKKYHDVKEIEYKHVGLYLPAVNKSMWKQHKRMFGADCNETCPCPSRLRELTKYVVRDAVAITKKRHPQWKPQWKNVDGMKHRDSPVGFTDRFVPKFYSRLQQEFPSETPAQLLERLLRMWERHRSQVRFGMKCPRGCECNEAWEILFKKGHLSAQGENEKTQTQDQRKGVSWPSTKSPSVPRRASVERGSSTGSSKDASLLTEIAQQEGPPRKKKKFSSEEGLEPAPQRGYEVTFSTSTQLGFFCFTMQNGLGKPICKILSVNWIGKGKEKRLRNGTRVLQAKLRSSDEWVAITKHEQLKEMYEYARGLSAKLQVRFVNTTARSTVDDSTHWTSGLAWRGDQQQSSGWAGGAPMASPRSNRLQNEAVNAVAPASYGWAGQSAKPALGRGKKTTSQSNSVQSEAVSFGEQVDRSTGDRANKLTPTGHPKRSVGLVGGASSTASVRSNGSRSEEANASSDNNSHKAWLRDQNQSVASLPSRHGLDEVVDVDAQLDEARDKIPGSTSQDRHPGWERGAWKASLQSHIGAKLEDHGVQSKIQLPPNDAPSAPSHRTALPKKPTLNAILRYTGKRKTAQTESTQGSTDSLLRRITKTPKRTKPVIVKFSDKFQRKFYDPRSQPLATAEDPRSRTEVVERELSFGQNRQDGAATMLATGDSANRGEELEEAILSKKSGDVLTLLQNGSDPDPEGVDPKKTPVAWAKKLVESLSLSARSRNPSTELANRLDDAEMKRVLIKMFILANYVMINARLLKKWDRYAISIEKFEDLTPREAARDQSIGDHVYCGITLKNDELDDLPPTPFSTSIDYSALKCPKYFANFNPALPKRNESKHQSLMLTPEIGSPELGVKLSLGELEVSLDEIAAAANNLNGGGLIEKDFGQSSYLRSGRVVIKVAKVPVDKKLYERKRREIEAQASVFLNTLKAFNRDTKRARVGLRELTVNDFTTRKEPRMSLLHAAIYLNEPKLVRALVELGADKNARSKLGRPTYLASNIAEGTRDDATDRNEKKEMARALQIVDILGISHHSGLSTYDNRGNDLEILGSVRASEPQGEQEDANTGPSIVEDGLGLAEARHGRLRNNPEPSIGGEVSDSLPFVPNHPGWLLGSKRPCRYFPTAKGCRNGRRCRYAHVRKLLGNCLPGKTFDQSKAHERIRHIRTKQVGRFYAAGFFDEQANFCCFAEGGNYKGRNALGLFLYSSKEDAISATMTVVAKWDYIENDLA